MYRKHVMGIADFVALVSAILIILLKQAPKTVFYIDFENQELSLPIDTQFQNRGVWFPGEPFVMGVITMPHSGSKALISAPLTKGFDSGPLSIICSVQQSQVKMNVGLTGKTPSTV